MGLILYNRQLVGGQAIDILFSQGNRIKPGNKRGLIVLQHIVVNRTAIDKTE